MIPTLGWPPRIWRRRARGASKGCCSPLNEAARPPRTPPPAARGRALTASPADPRDAAGGDSHTDDGANTRAAWPRGRPAAPAPSAGTRRRVPRARPRCTPRSVDSGSAGRHLSVPILGLQPARAHEAEIAQRRPIATPPIGEARPDEQRDRRENLNHAIVGKQPGGHRCPFSHGGCSLSVAQPIEEISPARADATPPRILWTVGGGTSARDRLLG